MTNFSALKYRIYTMKGHPQSTCLSSLQGLSTVNCSKMGAQINGTSDLAHQLSLKTANFIRSKNHRNLLDVVDKLR